MRGQARRLPIMTPQPRPAAREEFHVAGWLNLIPRRGDFNGLESWIHIVGLNIDVRAAMRDFLAQRTPPAASGALIGCAGVGSPYSARGRGVRLANGGAVTRGHFARFLVECGKAATVADV